MEQEECIYVFQEIYTETWFYNTLMQSNDPNMVIECLNGYRVKEKMPNNIGSFVFP